VLPLIHFLPDALNYSVPLFFKRQCDRTLGLAGHAGQDAAGSRGGQRKRWRDPAAGAAPAAEKRSCDACAG
jgi:hypothetical protein